MRALTVQRCFIHHIPVKGMDISPVISLPARSRIMYAQNAGTYKRGVKNRADLIVLNRTHVPAALIETGFMTNSKDMSLINSSSGRQAFANGIYKGIKSVISTYRLR